VFTKRQYAINTVVNYLAYSSNIIIALVLSPYVVSYLGDTFYGVWSIIVALTGYYSFLDFGIRQGVSQYVSRYLSSGDYKNFNKTLNSALVMLSGIGVAAALITVLVGLQFGDSLVKGGLESKVIISSFMILGCGIGIKFPLLLFQTVVTGKNRYDIAGLISFVVKIIQGISTWFVLSKGYGIIGLALVTTAAQIVESVLMMVAAWILVPQIRFNFSDLDIASLKDVVKYGFWNFIVGIAGQTTLYVGPLLIGKMLGPELVTYYSIGANLIPYYGSFVGILSIPLLQLVIAKDVKQETEELREMYLHGSRYVTLITTFIAFGLIVFGKQFLGKWMGMKYVSGDLCSSYTIMVILSIAMMIELTQTIGRQILFGVRKNKFLAIIYGGSSITTFIITLLSIKLYAATGAAMALLVHSVVTSGILLPFYLCRYLKIGLWYYFKNCIALNMIFFCTMTILGKALVTRAEIGSWFELILPICVASLMYLALGGFLIIGKDLLFKVAQSQMLRIAAWRKI